MKQAEQITQPLIDLPDNDMPIEQEKKRGNPALTKGMQSLNPSGRPKGSLNNVSKEIREIVGDFLATKALPHLIDRFESLSERNKIELSMQLMKYATPQLSATKIEADINTNIPMKVEIVYSTPSNNSTYEEAQEVE